MSSWWTIVQDARVARGLALRDEPSLGRVMGLEALEQELLAQMPPDAAEASEADELVHAAALLHAEGGAPSLLRAREIGVALRRLLHTGLRPDTLRALLQREAPGAREVGARRTLWLACALHERLARAGMYPRAERPLRLAERLDTDAAWRAPSRMVLRDLVNLTPARVHWLRAVGRSLRRRGGELQVSLPLIDRPLRGERHRDALEQLGDLYAEWFDEVPRYRVVDESTLAVPRVHREAERDQAQLRAMALLAAALDEGASAEQCALAWPQTPDDQTLRALAEQARATSVPLPATPRALSSRAVDELLRWAQLLGGGMRQGELQELLRSPLLEPSVSLSAPRDVAVRQLLAEPWPRGECAEVLAQRAARSQVEAQGRAAARGVRAVPAEAEQAARELAAHLAQLARTVQAAKTFAESLAAFAELAEGLGLHRGATRGGTQLFRQEDFAPGAEQALLHALAFEERAHSTWLRTHEELLAALWRAEASELPRRCGELARDLRVVLAQQTPRMAGELAAIATGPLGVLAATAPVRAVVLDASSENWGARAEALGAEFEAAAQLAVLGRHAEWLLLRIGAERIELVLADESGQHTVRPAAFMAEGALDASARGGAQLVPRAEDAVWAQREAAMAALTAEPALAERVRRSCARDAFAGDETSEADADNGLVPSGVPWLGGAEQPLAPAVVESFARCPFQGFVAHVLRAKEPEEVLASADPREDGSVLHALLEAAFVAAKPELERPDPVLAQVLAFGMEAARKAAAPWAIGVRAVQVRRVLVWVERALRQAAADREWRFEAAEVEFGPGAAWPAVEIDGVHFRGRLDRMDRSRADYRKMRVLDYKSSLPRKDGVRLQLPVYALAIERALGDVTVQHGVYLVPRRALHPKDGQLADVYESATVAVREQVLPVVAPLRRGELPPRPYDSQICQRCAARSVCRRPPFRDQESAE